MPINELYVFQFRSISAYYEISSSELSSRSSNTLT